MALPEDSDLSKAVDGLLADDDPGQPFNSPALPTGARFADARDRGSSSVFLSLAEAMMEAQGPRPTFADFGVVPLDNPFAASSVPSLQAATTQAATTQAAAPQVVAPPPPPPPDAAANVWPATDELRFIAIGDWGLPTDNARCVAAGMAAWARAQGPLHFVLGLGDNLYPGGATSVDDPIFQTHWWDVYVGAHPELRVPWKLVLGNHDYEASPEAQLHFSASPKSAGLWQLPSRCHSWTVPLADGTPVSFYALDTNGCQGMVRRLRPELEQTLHDDIASLEERLGQPLRPPPVVHGRCDPAGGGEGVESGRGRGRHDPAGAQASAWRIVLGHHPLYTAGKKHAAVATCLREEAYEHGGQMTRGYGLEGVLARGGCQAYFSGHEHVSQHHTARGVASFVCGAVTHVGFYGGRDASIELEWVDEAQQPTFAAVRITREQMTVQFVRARTGEVARTVVVPRE